MAMNRFFDVLDALEDLEQTRDVDANTTIRVECSSSSGEHPWVFFNKARNEVVIFEQDGRDDE